MEKAFEKAEEVSKEFEAIKAGIDKAVDGVIKLIKGNLDKELSKAEGDKKDELEAISEYISKLVSY